MDSLAKRLAYIRKLEGLTQEQVFDIGRPGAARVQRIEQDETNPPIDYLIMWAEKGYNLNWILINKGPIRTVENQPSNNYRSDLVLELIENLKGSKEDKKELLKELSKLQNKLLEYSQKLIDINTELDRL